MKKKIISISLIIVLTVITFYIVFSSSDMLAFPKLIQLLNPYFLVMAIGCMLTYMVVSGVIIFVISKELTQNITFKRALYLGFIGQYYSSITPFASGGQPFQIMILKNKYDVPIAKGTSITVKKYILYQVVISLTAIVMYFYRFNELRLHYSGAMVTLIFVGLLCNVLISCGIILLAYTDVHIKRIISLLLKVAHKIKLLKKITSEEINKHLDDYVNNIDDIKKNKKTMLGLFLLTFLQIILFFSVTYFIYLAFGQKGANYLDLISIQAMVYLVAGIVPTPGNVGASEGGFFVLLQPFFPTKLLFYAMAIWRVLTFYGVMIVSGLILLFVKFYETTFKKQMNK